MNHSPAVQNFRRIGTITIFAVYFLILVGGIVRASGSGMGCPDWPTCFGRWIPPTSESQLPQNYREIYSDRGYSDTRFNVTKTWTEYINRLIGVIIGILIFLTVLFSWPLRKSDPLVFGLSLAVFCLVGFQGWLGAMVVASNLLPVMVTVHMMVALLIVAILIYTITRSQKSIFNPIDASSISDHFRTVLIIAIAMTLAQIVMGTQIRETVDTIATYYSHSERHLWRAHFPLIFYVHRTFSVIILVTNSWLIWKLSRRVPRSSGLFRSAIVLAVLVVIAIATGITMDRFGIPPIAQPIHLLLALMIFGVQYFILIVLGNLRE